MVCDLQDSPARRGNLSIAAINVLTATKSREVSRLRHLSPGFSTELQLCVFFSIVVILGMCLGSTVADLSMKWLFLTLNLVLQRLRGLNDVAKRSPEPVPWDLANNRSCEIVWGSEHIVRQAAAYVKFQRGSWSFNPDIAASRLRDIYW